MHSILSFSFNGSRAGGYCSRHGFSATLRRFGAECYRAVFHPGFVVYRADLTAWNSDHDRATVVRRTSEEEIDGNEAACLSECKDPARVQVTRQRRFDRGAVLWILKINSQPAGFIWSVQAKPVGRYFFPLKSDETHLFDNEMLPAYRGRGLNPGLILYVLAVLKGDGIGQAYIETRTWNKAEMNSLKRTPFQPIALARWGRFSGRAILRGKNARHD